MKLCLYCLFQNVSFVCLTSHICNCLWILQIMHYLKIKFILWCSVAQLLSFRSRLKQCYILWMYQWYTVMVCTMYKPLWTILSNCCFTWQKTEKSQSKQSLMALFYRCTNVNLLLVSFPGVSEMYLNNRWQAKWQSVRIKDILYQSQRYQVFHGTQQPVDAHKSQTLKADWLLVEWNRRD